MCSPEVPTGRFTPPPLSGISARTIGCAIFVWFANSDSHCLQFGRHGQVHVVCWSQRTHWILLVEMAINAVLVAACVYMGLRAQRAIRRVLAATRSPVILQHSPSMDLHPQHLLSPQLHTPALLLSPLPLRSPDPTHGLLLPVAPRDLSRSPSPPVTGEAEAGGLAT